MVWQRPWRTSARVVRNRGTGLTAMPTDTPLELYGKNL